MITNPSPRQKIKLHFIQASGRTAVETVFLPLNYWRKISEVAAEYASICNADRKKLYSRIELFEDNKLMLIIRP